MAAIGLAVAACGNHDEKKADDTQPATVVPVPAETPKESTEEKEEHKSKTEEHSPANEHHEHTTTHHKDTTLVVTKGLPVIKDTAVLVKKPEGGGTMGSTTTTDGTVKRHPKPGGIQGNTPKSN